MKSGTTARILATLAVGGAALGAAGAAHADSAPLGGLPQLGGMKLYPLAHSGLDVLSNQVGSNLSGLPVSTAPINDFFEDGAPLGQVPLVGTLLGGVADGSAAPAAGS